MRLIYITIIAIFVTSCSVSKVLQKSLNSYKAPIGYLHDSRKTDVPATDSMVIRMNNQPLDSLTKVSRLHGLFLPLIVFNYSELNMSVKLGQNSIQQSYPDFFADSFTEESKRTGCFGITNREPTDSLYTLDITIDTCITNSKYRRTTTVMFLFFAYSMSFGEMGFPAETNLQVTTKLRKGNVLIAEKRYSIKHKQPFLNSVQRNPDRLRFEFTENMVESLSLSTKQCVEDVVKDINSSLKKN